MPRAKPEYRLTRLILANLLDSLGGTAEVIASRLRSEGAMGEQGFPVEVWLLKQGIRDPEVHDDFTIATNERGNNVGVPTPPALGRFVREYLAGHYREG